MVRTLSGQVTVTVYMLIPSCTWISSAAACVSCTVCSRFILSRNWWRVMHVGSWWVSDTAESWRNHTVRFWQCRKLSSVYCGELFAFFYLWQQCIYTELRTSELGIGFGIVVGKFWRNFFGRVGLTTSKNWFNFGGDLNRVTLRIKLPCQRFALSKCFFVRNWNWN